jgi:3-dehydroquinate dehydratase II
MPPGEREPKDWRRTRRMAKYLRRRTISLWHFYTILAQHAASAPWSDDRHNAVGILLVHGPHTTSTSLTQELQRELQQQADAGGRTLELRACDDLHDLVVKVCAAKSDATEFVLLDPGNLVEQVRAHPEAGFAEALDKLDAPYIEVYEEFGAKLAHDAGFHSAPIATVIINGNIGSGYRIGLGIALRQLDAERRRADFTSARHFNAR